jgi:SAM-dependent methyltransferase
LSAAPLLPGVDAVARCEGCGTGYTIVTLPTDAQDLFDERVYRGYFKRAEQWRHEARKRLRWLLETVHPGRLLEIGCAGGFFVETARLAGIDARGVELSPKAARYARTQLGLPVHVGPFEELASPEQFEAICAFHVLEHVDEPIRFLLHASERLERNGTLALEVPNIASARARSDGSAWAGLQVDRHRWHFSPPALAKLVEALGFSVRRLDTVSPRWYMRGRDQLSRPGLALLSKDLFGTRTWKATHRTSADYIRLIATKR